MININHDHVTANALTEGHTVKSHWPRRLSPKQEGVSTDRGTFNYAVITNKKLLNVKLNSSVVNEFQTANDVT